MLMPWLKWSFSVVFLSMLVGVIPENRSLDVVVEYNQPFILT